MKLYCHTVNDIAIAGLASTDWAVLIKKLDWIGVMAYISGMLVLPRKLEETQMKHSEPHIRRTAARLSRLGYSGIDVMDKLGSLVLEGEVESYQEKIAIGWAAAKTGFKAVVNDIRVPGVPEETFERLPATDGLLDGSYYDAVIIGGGVIGCAIARELSRWNLSIVLLEKEGDVAVHTSSRNDGMIHDGFAAKPGSKKAEYNVRGNRLWEPLCRELGIEFKRPGSLVLFHSALAVAAYPVMAERARRNRVDGWEFWSRARVAAEEPHVVADQHGAFFLPSAGVLSPYKATVALAESAMLNGVRVVLDACVTALELDAGRVERVVTNRGTCRAGVVINAAGNWAVLQPAPAARYRSDP